MAILLTINGLRLKFGGAKRAGWLPNDTSSPKEEETVVELRIESTPEGFFLFSESSHPHFRGGDSWHQSLNDALEQARLQFGVKPEDWTKVPIQ